MSREGFSTDELSSILRVHRNSTTESINPALRKTARLFAVDAAKFLRTWLPFVEEADAELIEEAQVRALEGRCDTPAITRSACASRDR